MCSNNYATICLTLDFVDSNKSQLKPMKDENE